jgi:site-specific DNA-cytosine methylase
MAIKILIGGSPCTHWSIAQKNNRETEPSGMGWELFKNYLIAKEKFNPDFFLYENNKSAAQAIKDQIAKELGVGKDPKVRFTYINSALVSAQNRQRFYVTNFGEIEQPEDRGILLKDILEYGFDLSHERKQRPMVAEPVCVAQRGRYTGENGAVQQNFEARFDGKTNTITTVSKDNLVAEPVALNTTTGGKSQTLKAQYGKNSPLNAFRTWTFEATMISEPVRVGCYPSPDGTLKNSQGMRLYSIEGKSVNLTANGGGMGGKTGLYTIPIEFVDDVPVKAVSCADGKEYPVYQVLNGQITIKGKTYPIKLIDGYYIIRKLTVTEGCRLQTLPDDYCKAVSATQGYKGLGNGWTAEVIIHLLNHALKDVPRNEEIVVLSLYDGIGTGRYCLEKMGFTNVKYYAYEIDKYPMAIANDNYPDIIQCGDAFAVREDSWKPPKTRSEWLDELLEVTA